MAAPPPDPADLDALIRKAQDSDRNALAALAEHYWDRVHRWLYQLCRDRHAAEDLTQDTLLKAIRGLGKFEPGTNFRGWLFRIAHNTFANYCRDRKRPDSLPGEVPAPDLGPLEVTLSREALRELHEAVEQLPVEYRAALLLRVEEDLSFRQIGDVLGLTEETARWRVFKARQKLLALLAPRQEQETS